MDRARLFRSFFYSPEQVLPALDAELHLVEAVRLVVTTKPEISTIVAPKLVCISYFIPYISFDPIFS